MKNRVLSLALSLMLVLSLLPFGASAAEIVDSGEYGENLTWTLDSNGLLTISGKGEMEDYYWSGSSPFYNNDSITSVVIKPGVTRIGIWAFENCPNLTNVKIPKSVTSIGAGAFRDCTSLGSVTIPDSVSNIQMDAFTGTALYNDESNWENGVLYIDSFLIKAKNDALPQKYKIKEGTAIIANSAFSGCSNLTSVTIPNSVTSVGVFSFEECTSLTDVAIPNSVTNIGDAVFYHCTSLKTAVISGSVKELPGYEGDWGQEFGFFSGCTSLRSVELGEGIESIGDYAFYGCENLESIAIPCTLKSISGSSFTGCDKLSSIDISDLAAWCKNENNLNYSSLLANGGEFYLNGKRVTNLVIPEGVESIGDDVFYKRTGLTSVTIPDSVTKIESSAFSGCTGLTSVKIGNGVTHLGRAAFGACSGLKDVVIPGSVETMEGGIFSFWTGSGPGSEVSGAFSNCTGLTNVTIEDGAKIIGDYAFYGCTSLTGVKIPDSVKSIGSGAFSGCTSLKVVTLGKNVTSIGGSAFSGCTGLTSVMIPDGVKSIENGAFSGCDSLKEATLGKNVATIGNSAFFNCSSLRTVTIPANVTTIEENAFDGTRLKDVYFTGTQEQWDDILIRNGNEALFRAALHLNAAEPEPTDPPTAKNPFKDVKSGAYYYEPVLWAVNHDPQITNGTGADTFSPDQTCTRGQVVTFLWRAAGCPEPKSTNNPFEDVSKDAYYYKAVLWAVEKGVTNGTSKTTFSPNASCTRGQVVTFQYRANGEPKVDAKNPFTDVAKGQYYYNAVLWAVKNEITNGTSATTFSPNSTCTRGQIVTFLYRDKK